MPIYEYKCKVCNVRFEELHKVENRHKQSCIECGEEVILLMPSSTGRDWFRPHLNENLGIKPIYVESKKHYKRLCKERGLTARCLM